MIKYVEQLGIRYLNEAGNTREVLAIKEDGEWLFTIGCQENITKEKFINRIYNENGGFDLEKGVNVHRGRYLNFLKEF